jgi:pSer/pThr/pTyr-binding forkhead associated (FHA) protein
VARAAHALADRVHGGDLARVHLAQTAPLLRRITLDDGPARLQFLERDYPLHGPAFTLGRQPGCDLVFDSAHYPTVSARHCEILFDGRRHLLRDRSRNGTLLNDRPVMQQAMLQAGDWIRLGPDGPLLRFLGQADGQTLGTTA